MSSPPDPSSFQQPKDSSAVACFDFYGLTIAVSGALAELVKELQRDFSYFRIPTRESQVQVRMHLVVPPYEKLPSVPSSLITPRNVCFRKEGITYIDYFGRALAVFDRAKQACDVYATDRDLMHEIVYLYFLSTVGQHLDERGLHRIHALGVSHQGKGILLLLPSGGGKSTMALKLLEQPDFLLLGEDTPLIDRRGRVLPFPLRLGVRPGHQTGLPPEQLRTVRRMELDPQTLIDIDHFRDRVGQAVKPSLLLVGERNLGPVSEIVPLPRHRAFKALLKYMVVGLGVYQGLEFILERGIGDVLRKRKIVLSRLYNSFQLLARAQAYRFVLGRDVEKNRLTLLDFLRRSNDADVPPE